MAEDRGSTASRKQSGCKGDRRCKVSGGLMCCLAGSEGKPDASSDPGPGPRVHQGGTVNRPSSIGVPDAARQGDSTVGAPNAPHASSHSLSRVSTTQYAASGSTTSVLGHTPVHVDLPVPHDTSAQKRENVQKWTGSLEDNYPSSRRSAESGRG